MKPSRFLYRLARKSGKAATKMNDIEMLLSGDPKKIAKRYISKKTHGVSHKTANKAASSILRKLFK